MHRTLRAVDVRAIELILILCSFHDSFRNRSVFTAVIQKVVIGETGWGPGRRLYSLSRYQGGDTEEERERASLKFGEETLSDDHRHGY